MPEPIYYDPGAPDLLHIDRADRRARRVMVLLFVVTALGLADLYATYTHASSVGMHEENPIGAYLITAGSWAGLTLYKLGTIGLAVGLLLKVRRQRSAECAAWFICLVMVALTMHWHEYNHEMSTQLANVSYEQVAEQMRLTNAMPGS